MSRSNISLLPTKRNTSEGVAERSGVKKNKLQRLRFKGTLGYAASRIHGGRKVFMEFVRIASQSDERLLPLVEKWDSLSRSDKRYVNLDDLCEAVGIRPGMVLGTAAEAAFDYNTDVSKLMAAVAQPAIVQATIDSALTPEGVQDRKLLHQHSRFLPTQHGTVVNVEAKAVAAAQSTQIGLPKFEDDMGEDHLAIDVLSCQIEMESLGTQLEGRPFQLEVEPEIENGE